MMQSVVLDCAACIYTLQGEAIKSGFLKIEGCHSYENIKSTKMIK